MLGCGVAPREEPLSPVVAALRLNVTFILGLDFSSAASAGAGEDFSSTSGERDCSLVDALRSLVEARRADDGVSVAFLPLVLLAGDSFLTGVEVSAVVAASATLLDARRARAGAEEPCDSAFIVADVDAAGGGDGSGEAARGVAAGPGVGGGDTSERSESPSKASIVTALWARCVADGGRAEAAGVSQKGGRLGDEERKMI